MMKQNAELAQKLRALKLSSILETLELRILEAQKNQLDYRSFLIMLLDDELENRQQTKVQKLIKHARFGLEKTLESFDFCLNPHVNQTLIRELATCAFVHRGEGIILTGPPGTGKTHLAKALGHEACRRQYTVFFYKFHQLFDELTKAELSGNIASMLKKLIHCDLLIIDDFAFTKITQQQSEYLYNIVDAKYGVKTIILTSNRAIADWMNVFPDPVIAGAILDRIAHQAHQVQLKGESIRKKLAKNSRSKSL